jgi:hypothetical protein
MKLPASSLGRPLPGGQDLGVLAVGVELLAGWGGRACGTLVDIWLLGMTDWELFRAISCHSFWWDVARGETRESIWAAPSAGQAWILVGLWLIGCVHGLEKVMLLIKEIHMHYTEYDFHHKGTKAQRRIRQR